MIFRPLSFWDSYWATLRQEPGLRVVSTCQVHFVCLLVCFLCLNVCLFVCLFVCMFACLFVVCLCVCLCLFDRMKHRGKSLDSLVSQLLQMCQMYLSQIAKCIFLMALDKLMTASVLRLLLTKHWWQLLLKDFKTPSHFPRSCISWKSSRAKPTQSSNWSKFALVS